MTRPTSASSSSHPAPLAALATPTPKLARTRRTPLERAAREAARLARAEQRAQRRAIDAMTASYTSRTFGIPMPRTPGPSGDPCTIEVGSEAEALAVRHLEEHGYVIVERNYKCDLGEVDIIALDGDALVFIEVRSRATDEHGDAVESVTRAKQRKVTLVAEVYFQHERPEHAEYRFDVVAINGDRIDLYRDAWRGGLLR